MTPKNSEVDRLRPMAVRAGQPTTWARATRLGTGRRSQHDLAAKPLDRVYEPYAHNGAEALVDAPALAPGEFVTVSMPCQYGTPSATARADATYAVEESDEANNAGASTPGEIFCRFP
jgi:hypothetical protein